RGRLRLLDAGRRLGLADLDEAGDQLLQVAAAGGLLGDLAEAGELRGLPHGDGSTGLVEHEPRVPLPLLVRAEVEAPEVERLRNEDSGETLARCGERLGRRRDPLEILGQRHARDRRLGTLSEASPRTRHARELFAPLGPTYDRYASLLSFGQDPRWRRFLVSRIPASAPRVLDVATGTGAVAIELARAEPSRTVVGV